MAEGDRRVGQVMPVDTRRVDLQTRAVICALRALVNCFAERTPTFVVIYAQYVRLESRATGVALCNMQTPCCCVVLRSDPTLTPRRGW